MEEIARCVTYAKLGEGRLTFTNQSVSLSKRWQEDMLARWVTKNYQPSYIPYMNRYRTVIEKA
jgi:hypothetical protein